MAEEVVAREMAESELARWESVFELSIAKGIEKNEKKKDDDDYEGNAIEDAKETVLQAIMVGYLTIEDDGTMVLKTPRFTAPYRFQEPDGHAHTCLDKNSAGFLKFLAAITNKTPEQFRKLKQRDLRICQSIGMLFLVPSA